MRVAFCIDHLQHLAEPDLLRLVRLGAELGYDSAWTPAGPDAAAFDRCLSWHRESGLATGISVVPASSQPPAFYATHASRVCEGTGGRFVLGVGSGRMAHPAREMRGYLAELRRLLPPDLPVYLAATGPLVLRLAGEVADGVALNWCSSEQVMWARQEVGRGASEAGRPLPVVAEYIRTAVDPDPVLSRSTLGVAMRQYALGPTAYRRLFERKGFADELRELEAGGREPSDALLEASGAHGRPGAVRAQFERLAAGLDLAIVRVLVTRPGDAESARRVLEECAPGS